MFRIICSLTIVFSVSFSGWSEPGNWGEPQTPLAAGVTVPAGVSPEEQTPIQQAKTGIDLSTPRKTLTSFLTAMNAAEAGRSEYLIAALQCIYLLDLPEGERVSKGTELAESIHQALGSITIAMEDFEELSEGTRDVELELGDESKVSVFFRLNDDQVWRFSYAKMTASVESRDVVVEEAAVAAGELETDSRVDERLANPRATMRTFLNAFNEGRWEEGGRDDAIATLDLSDISANVIKERGEELAALLKKILDRDHIVVYQEYPETQDGSPVVVLVDPTDQFERRKIEIVPIPIDDDSEVVQWKFSKESLALLTDLWDNHYVNLDPVAGFQSEAPELLSLQIRDWVGKNAPYLTNRWFFFENWKWLGLFLSIILGMIVSRIIAEILLRIVRRAFRQKHSRLDGTLEADFVQPVRIGIMAWVWWIAIKPLSLPASTLGPLKVVIITISSSAFVWAVYRLVDIFGSYISEKARLSENKYDDMVVPLIVRSLKIFVIVIGFIFVCEMNDWNYLTALAGFGLIGMALALAAQDTLGNIFGSITVLIDRPFQIGDWVQIDDVDGNVESVGIRSTRIRTFYNSIVTVPNSALTNAVIDNYGARRYRRIKMDIGITYDTPPEKIDAFCEGIRELIRQHPYTRTDYFHVYLNSFGASSLNILLYCFHECPEWSTELRERHRLLLDIVRLAKNLGVEFAFPTSTLYMQQVDQAGHNPEVTIANEAALEDGRQAARGIVEEYLGKNAHVPPPVTFESPNHNVGETEGDEGDS